MVLSAVDKCSFARLEHFAKFQKRKGKFFDDRKKQLRHAVGKKTKREKEEEEKREGQEKSCSAFGGDDADEDKSSEKSKDESPQKAQDKGKGKEKYEDKKGSSSPRTVPERKHEKTRSWLVSGDEKVG
jgi:hypothetical protein